MTEQITLGSLFDGIGAFPYAASFYGIKTVWASEILPVAVSVTRRHFPDMIHVGDITKLSGELLTIAFGSPCQGLSNAGLRRGMKDERSGLFMEVIRIINEMRCATNGRYPRFAIWENVVGAFSSGTPKRSDYKAVLEALTACEIPMPTSQKWANAGMVRSDRVDLAWCVYSAQHFGVPQRRRCIFLVADFGGTSAGKILFVPKSLRGYFAASGASWQGASSAAETGIDGAVQTGGVAQIARTLTARGDSSPCADRGQNIVVIPQSEVYGICAQNSNSMLSDNPRSGIYRADTSRTLDQNGGNPACNQGGMAVVSPNCEVHPDIAGTLCASGAGLSRPAGMVSETDLCVVYCLQGNMIGRKDENGPAGSGVNENISFALTGADKHAVSYTFGNNSYGGWSDESANLKAAGGENGGGSENVVVEIPPPYIVRRLTPTECERLMGLPDGWTAFGDDGKTISDSKRYQMLGNSIVAPCAAYIMQGILEQYEEK